MTAEAKTFVVPNSSPWGDKQIARAQFRVELFMRRGESQWWAETLADRLAERDHERDDRRLCLECQHLQRDNGCFAAKQGRVPDLDKSFNAGALRQTLMRCPAFKWVTP
jgi:hypothetical protein